MVATKSVPVTSNKPTGNPQEINPNKSKSSNTTPENPVAPVVTKTGSTKNVQNPPANQNPAPKSIFATPINNENLKISQNPQVNQIKANSIHNSNTKTEVSRESIRNLWPIDYGQWTINNDSQ